MKRKDDHIQPNAPTYTGQIIKALSGFYYVEEKESQVIYTQGVANLEYANNTIGGRFCGISTIILKKAT